jgi:hypothetical protein
MTTRDEMERLLRRAVEVEPTGDAVRWLDQRVAAIAARPVSTQRLAIPSLRLIFRPVVLLTAFVLLTGAVAAALGLLDRTVESSGMPGWRIAYDRAEVLGIRQTDAGYTITLERAYGDLNQVMAFFTVESAAGLEAPAATEGTLVNHFSLNAADLHEPGGHGAIARTAIADIEPGIAAAVEAFQFDAAPLAGTYQLTISEIGYGASGPGCVSPCMDDEIAGSWQFEFQLPAPAGTVVPTDATDTVGSATLNLTELRVSPTMVTARIEMSLGGSRVATWSTPLFVVRHLDTSYDVNSAASITEGDGGTGTGATVFFTTAGTDEVAGIWEIQIPELTYQTGVGDEVSLTGPWTFTVNVP